MPLFLCRHCHASDITPFSSHFHIIIFALTFSFAHYWCHYHYYIYFH
jgi:hypothetical protein